MEEERWVVWRNPQVIRAGPCVLLPTPHRCVSSSPFPSPLCSSQPTEITSLGIKLRRCHHGAKDKDSEQLGRSIYKLPPSTTTRSTSFADSPSLLLRLWNNFRCREYSTSETTSDNSPTTRDSHFPSPGPSKQGLSIFLPHFSPYLFQNILVWVLGLIKILKKEGYPTLTGRSLPLHILWNKISHVSFEILKTTTQHFDTWRI